VIKIIFTIDADKALAESPYLLCEPLIHLHHSDMQQPTTPTRKKFLLWSAVILSSATVLKFFTGSKKPKLIAEGKNKGKVKMLTQDGKLVEIDKEMLVSGGKKISNEELQQWINK
jgi:hypothetical protein